jgi:hypothetical protein
VLRRWRTSDRDLTLLHVVGFGLIGLAVGWPLAVLSGWPRWVALPLLVPVLGGAMVALHRGLAASAGATLLRATGAASGGATGGAFVGMSAVDALVARGEIDAAIDRLRVEQFAYEGESAAIIAQRLAELLWRAGRVEEAAPAYRRARRAWEQVPTVAGREGRTYATRRLIDLYDGPLANPAAAMAERRRLGGA